MEDDELTEIPTDIPRGVVEVRISSQTITTVKTDAFHQLSDCIYLQIGPSISEIEARTFNGIRALTNLSLGHNRLKRLSINMFSGINRCKWLNLIYNQISEIEPGAFNGLTGLTNLTISYNRLERLSVNMFSDLKNCKWLDLDRNRINQIEPGTFDGLGNLVWLNLRYNSLTTLRNDTFRGTV